MPMTIARWDELLDGFAGGQSGAGIPVDSGSALKWSVVFGCVQVLSQDEAKTPLNTYRRLGKYGDAGRETARDHALWQRFRVNANPYMTAFVYRQTMQRHLSAVANAYSLIERDAYRNVIALWPRMPQSVRPKIESGRLVYICRTPGGAEERYEADQVFHLKGMSDDGIIGISPIDMFRDGIGLGLAYQRHEAGMLKNGANPPWYIEFDKEVGAEKAQEVLEKFRTAYSGVENAGKIPGMYGGMSAKSLGFSNEQIQRIEALHFGVEEGCRMWRVPPTKLMDFLRATFSNITETNIAYVNDSLRPHQENWEQEIHFKLLREDERETYYVEHDNYDLLKGTPKERAEIECAYVDKGISNINEVRGSHNWNPVAGGDVNRTQMQNVPLESADRLAQQNSPATQPGPAKGTGR